MNILTSLDVLIGLIVIYLTLALVCTVINEWIDATLHVRSAQLRRSIFKMLSTLDEKSLGEGFFKHPMVKSLERETNFWIVKPQDKPTYISNRTFRETLLDLLKKVVNDQTLNFEGTFVELEESLQKLPESDIKTQLLVLVSEVKRATQKAEE